MSNEHTDSRTVARYLAVIILASMSTTVIAGDVEFAGFAENATFVREDVGLSKMRNTIQLELEKAFDKTGPFSSVFISGTARGTYDAVYDLNDQDYGKNAGSSILLQQVGLPAGALFPAQGRLVSPGKCFWLNFKRSTFTFLSLSQSAMLSMRLRSSALLPGVSTIRTVQPSR